MSPETSAADAPAAGTRQRAARLVQQASAALFIAAALSMLIAGALHSAGITGASAASATLGYALGVVGIATGVLSLALETDQEPS